MIYRWIFVVFCLALPQLAVAKDFLWRVRTNDSVVYLVGSFHLMRQSDATNSPFPIASFEEAFAQSRQVVLEANPFPDEAAISRHLQRTALLPQGASLRSMLPASAYSKMRRLLIADGAPSNVIDHLRPWFVSINLSRIFAEKVGFESEYGIDRRYYDLAGTHGKPRLYLETPIQQLNALAAGPQAEWLAGIRRQLAVGSSPFEGNLGVYKAGDLETIAEGVAQSAVREPGITRSVLVNRNLKWLPKIEAYLQTSQTTMVVAGVAHMVRGNGLPALLQKRGYDVVRLPEDPPPVAAAVPVEIGAQD